MRREKLRRFFDGQLHDVADGLFVIENLQRLRIVTATVTVLAQHITARQKIHLQLDHGPDLCMSRNARPRR